MREAHGPGLRRLRETSGLGRAFAAPPHGSDDSSAIKRTLLALWSPYF